MMKTLIIVSITVAVMVCPCIPSIHAGARITLEPSMPVYSTHPRGMEAGSYGNPYEVRSLPSGKVEVSTPFVDPSRPSGAPGQPVNPYEGKLK